MHKLKCYLIIARYPRKYPRQLNSTKVSGVKKLTPVPNAAPLMCRTKLNTVRLWSHFGATADSDGVLASDLIREGHGKQFSMRLYAF